MYSKSNVNKYNYSAALIFSMTFFLPFLTPALLLYNKELSWDGLKTLPLAIPGLILLFILSIYIAKKEVTYKTRIISEFAFLLWKGKYAWIVGSILGFIAAIIYIGLPFDKNNIELGERIASSFTIYYGVIATTLGIHILNKRTGPITSVYTLLEHVAEDLSKYKAPGYKVLFAFPALNIGFFRSLTKYKDVESIKMDSTHPYTIFLTNLREATDLKQNRAIAITYPEIFIKSLFKTYEEKINYHHKEKSKALANLCYEEAKRLNKLFSDNGQHLPLHPNSFPDQVIVIGPVCYSLLSFGIPRYIEDKEKFRPSNDDVAQLIAYRYEDFALANLILEETLEFTSKQVKNYQIKESV